MTTKIETYKGVEICKELDPKDPRPFITIKQTPVIGVLQVGHKTLEDARQYIDKTEK